MIESELLYAGVVVGAADTGVVGGLVLAVPLWPASSAGRAVRLCRILVAASFGRIPSRYRGRLAPGSLPGLHSAGDATAAIGWPTHGRFTLEERWIAR